jgi:hypothetical protein
MGSDDELNNVASSYYNTKFKLFDNTEVNTKLLRFRINNLRDIKLSQKQVMKYIRIIQKSINYYREIIENNKNYITVTYEDLYSENGLQKVKEILGFLNVPLINEEKTLELLSPKYKLNKKPWHETIKNYKEIKKMFIKL